MSFFDDLVGDDLNGYELAKAKTVDVKAEAHVMHGGEAMRTCGGCHGTGRWKGRGPCYACKGKGKVTARTQKAQEAHAKGKVTAANNLANRQMAFDELNPGLRDWMREKSQFSNFIASVLAQLDSRGQLSDNQMKAVLGAKAKDEDRLAEYTAKRNAEQDARSVAADLSAIHAMFDKARESGLKKLQYRAHGLVLTPAKEGSVNAGGIYVKAAGTGVYLGKVMGTKFMCTREATDAHKDTLAKVAADPAGEAKAYGKATGICCCCGKELTDPNSIAAGIGPICATKWSF